MIVKLNETIVDKPTNALIKDLFSKSGRLMTVFEFYTEAFETAAYVNKVI